LIRRPGVIPLGVLLKEGPSRQVDPALIIDTDNFDHYLVTDVDFVFNLVDAVAGQFTDMNQSFLTGKDLHHRAEIKYTRDLAGIDFTDFDIFSKTLDDSYGFLG